ncbi:MAG: MBL fold metallo-hydrolase [Planctomycetes bacterium]|nr:MBL fold metallo-hydrolase [Planctomycetota bacterium]
MKNLIILCIFCLVLVGSTCQGASGSTKRTKKEKKQITVTVLYDNYVFAKGLKSDWGFSCLVTGTEKNILFDTGMKGELLLYNIGKLGVEPKDVEIVVISHSHRDHFGGLLSFLGKNSDVLVYLPVSCPETFVRKVKQMGARVVTADAPIAICKGVHLTGQMGHRIIEQSMIVDTAEGSVVVTGCSRPGIVEIVRKAKSILPKDIYLVFGGFHLLGKSEPEIKNIIKEFKRFGVKKVGPTHCTGDTAIGLFKQAYGSDFVKMGVGRVLKIQAISK